MCTALMDQDVMKHQNHFYKTRFCHSRLPISPDTQAFGLKTQDQEDSNINFRKPPKMSQLLDANIVDDTSHNVCLSLRKHF